MDSRENKDKVKLDALKKKAADLPDLPGVYLFKDSQGKIIYIGKAKSLKKRVSSYFTGGISGKNDIMMPNVCDLEYRLTPTESFALLLEARLVHKYRPKYNVSLRDDKSFPYVKITKEEFPAICITRKRRPDGSRYIGPFTSAKLLRQALAAIRRALPFRSCESLPEEARMYYNIGLSPVSAAATVKKSDYARTIGYIALLLEGKTDSLIRKLGAQMREKAKEQKFEQAARLRDSIKALEQIGRSRARPLKNAAEVEDLKNILRLPRLPLRIEAFDISNISGKEACGSMVSFYQGSADKNNYRRFRIKTVFQIDDYKMLAEVIYRRYGRLVREKRALPDLILVDGGKGQLKVAADELIKLKLNIPLIAIAKEQEYIYRYGIIGPLKFKEGTAGLNLIRKIRDEAHRFAVSYHHILRRKKVIGG